MQFPKPEPPSRPPTGNLVMAVLVGGVAGRLVGQLPDPIGAVLCTVVVLAASIRMVVVRRRMSDLIDRRVDPRMVAAASRALAAANPERG